MSGSFWLDSNSKRYYPGIKFSYGDINYTTKGATAETFTSLGFTEVLIQPRPDDRFYFVNGPDDSGAYTATPRQLEDSTDPETGDVTTGLKSQYIKQVDTEQGQLLGGSDWMVTRKTETGQDLDPEWQQYRDNVRLTGPQRLDQISQCSTVEELRALLTNPAEVWDEDSGRAVMNTEPHLVPWPEQPTT